MLQDHNPDLAASWVHHLLLGAVMEGNRSLELFACIELLGNV